MSLAITYEKHATLTHADIVALSGAQESFGVPIVRAPGPGRLIVFHAAVVRTRIVTGYGWNDVESSNPYLMFNVGGVQASLNLLGGDTGQLFQSGSNQVAYFPHAFLGGTTPAPMINSLSACANQPLTLYLDTPFDDLTGDPDNVVKITAYYSVVPPRRS